MKRDEAIAYKESLKSMTKGELIKNSMSLKRRLDKLSDICDVEDTYRAMIEQGQAERKAESLKRKCLAYPKPSRRSSLEERYTSNLGFRLPSSQIY